MLAPTPRRKNKAVYGVGVRSRGVSCRSLLPLFTRMAEDEEGYVDSFEQADDNVLMAAIKQRDTKVTPLLK